MIFVSSWDDGHPSDLRLAELLSRYGLRGTFYVPIHNLEGRAVMSVDQLRELDTAFELGSHTFGHIYLPRLSRAECVQQITEGKVQLEDALGHGVDGFCYPGGKLNRSVRQRVIDAGFTHARTTSNLWLSEGKDAFTIPTTAQFYPHNLRVLWRNFLKGGNYGVRAKAFQSLVRPGNRFDAFQMLVNRFSESDYVLHFWGHSWEIDKYNLWHRLEKFLSFVASLRPTCLTVSELVDARGLILRRGN